MFICIAIAIILLIMIISLINNKTLWRGDDSDVGLSTLLNKMQITSAFEHGSRIPEKYTADGDNVSPPLGITEIPEETKSLVLIIDDPDAQRVVGYTWVHWVVFNIPVSGSEVKIKENSLPGTAGESTYKKPEYRGPNPPAGSGIHNYYFKVYALDRELELNEMSSLINIKNSMQGHVLDKAELMGVYSRG